MFLIGITLTTAVALLLIFVSLVLALLALGRRNEARALAGFIPDCLVLLRRLFGDDRVPRSRKLALVFLLAYLASPIDLIPDFIPVVGQLDDAILAAVVLRFVLRDSGPSLLDQHWPGPPQGARLIGRIAFGAQRSAPISISESRPDPARATEPAPSAATITTTAPTTFRESVTYSSARPEP